MKIQIYLIRHGKTAANLEHRYLGTTDEELCEIGKRELEKRKQDMPHVDLLFSSPMIRCRQTCDILFPAMTYDIVEEYREMNFGDFERKNYKELKENADYQRWIDSNGTIAFPNGENREQFIERQMTGFEKMCDTIKEKQKAGNEITRVAAVVHGGTIMAVLSALSGGEYFDFQCKNGQGYSFHWEDSKMWDINLFDVAVKRHWSDTYSIWK